MTGLWCPAIVKVATRIRVKRAMWQAPSSTPVTHDEVITCAASCGFGSGHSETSPKPRVKTIGTCKLFQVTECLRYIILLYLFRYDLSYSSYLAALILPPLQLMALEP